MATQFNCMEARVAKLPDGLEVTGGTPLTGTEVDSDNEHRIAMRLVIVALNAFGVTTLHRAETVAISYSDFTATLQHICN